MNTKRDQHWICGPRCMGFHTQWHPVHHLTKISSLSNQFQINIYKQNPEIKEPVGKFPKYNIKIAYKCKSIWRDAQGNDQVQSGNDCRCLCGKPQLKWWSNAQFRRHLGCKPWFWQWCTKTRSETMILEDHEAFLDSSYIISVNLVIEADFASPAMITDVLVASLNLSDNWMAQFRRHSGCKPWLWQWCTKTMSETTILEDHDTFLNSSYTISVSLVIEADLAIFRLLSMEGWYFFFFVFVYFIG